jgi:glycosyltransferase involved in cell wall biosynthesis
VSNVRDPARHPGASATALIAHPGAELYGSDRMMLETIAALVERDWRVVVAVTSEGPLTAEAERRGAEVLILAAPVLHENLIRPRNLPAFFGGSVTAWRRIGLLLARVRPDVVYVSTLTVPLWIARARSMRIPVVAHVHASERQAPTVVRAAIALPLRLADRVLVNSDFSRESLIEILPSLARQSLVVYNGIAGPSSVTPACDELHGGLRVVYVGRLSPRKGVDIAVAAIARLMEQGIDARLDLVGSVFTGDEWYERQLHQQVEALGLADRVTFRGFQSFVWGALEDADVAVVPSRLEESFGNTAVEAVLAGRPAVVSVIGGLAEAIDGFACAIPVPPDDVDAMADALQRIATNWSTFRRTAATFAPIAAHRYSIARYRATVAAEIARAARVVPQPLLAS